MISILTIAVLVAAGVAATWSGYQARLDVEFQRAEARAAEAAAAIDQFFDDRIVVLDVAAAFPALTDGDADARSRALNAASDPGLGFAGGVGWIDPEGQLLAESGVPPDALPLDLSDRAYVQSVLRDEMPVVSDAIKGRLSGDLLVVVAVPAAASDGTLTGILIASVRVADLDASLRALRPADGLRIVDDQGRLVMIDGEAASLDPVPRPSALRPSGDGAAVGTGVMGVPGVVTATARADTPGWTVVAETDGTAVSSGARTAYYRDVGVLLALAVVGAVGIALSTRRTAVAQARTRRFAGDLAAVEQLTERLSGAAGRLDVAEVALTAFGAEFRPSIAVVALVDEEARRMETLAAHGGDESILREFQYIPLDAATMLTDTWREGRTSVLDVEAYTRQYPATAQVARDQGITLAIAAPFTSQRASGAVSLAFADRAALTSDERRRFEAMVPLLGDAVERAVATDRQATALATMQRALLPDDRLPGDSSVQRSTRYLPASDANQVGGDWYDIIESGGRTVVTVGDVVGRGIPAAAVMGQLRSACRAIALEHPDPAVILRHLDAFARSVKGAFASTAVVGVIDGDDRTLVLASAGHLPPVIASADGVRVHHEVRGTPLGVVGAPRAAVRMPFDDGDTLVLCTDGLVERRGEVIDVGLARPADAVRANGHLPVGELADRLVAVAGDERSDDVALVCLRIAPDSARTLSFAVTARPSELATARRRLRRWLHAIGVDGPRVDDVILAVGEVTSNAIEHAYRGVDDGVVEIEGEVQDEVLSFTVTDHGRWSPADLTRPHGRGLAIVRALARDVTVRRSPAGTRVTLSMDRRPM